MLSPNYVYIVTLCLTAASGLGATALVVFGDTRRNAAQRAVKLAQIAVIGASAIVALLQTHN